MDEKKFANQLALLRRESGKTQEQLADRLRVSPQAVSKWENGHSLPETALLPEIARLLDISIDALFSAHDLVVLEALFGDGMESANVTNRLNRLIENDVLNIRVSTSLVGVNTSEQRISYLIVKYQSSKGICYAAASEGESLVITGDDAPAALPDSELSIIAGRYGTKKHNYDVMFRIEHFKPFNWNEYRATHSIFPSDPANDQTEYLTLVYMSSTGIHMSSCAEGESLEYADNKTHLVRKLKDMECFIADVPILPPFGEGMECSWAAALTAALQAMRMNTDYDEVMGVSGACYRLAFCSPGWDYSSVDGLVAYDYAMPGFAAFGFTPEQYGHIEKSDRAKHRQKIMKELRDNMPVLGINLRVAHEWGVICGYAKDGEDLFCRTKYDMEIYERDNFIKGDINPYDYLYVDNWPFLICYFNQKRMPPTSKENLISSLKVFADCVKKPSEGGYYMGFKAYEVWASDLRDDRFYDICGDEMIARRFSVNQFCSLALFDARRSACSYLKNSLGLIKSDLLVKIAECFEQVFKIAEGIHHMLDSGVELDGPESREFWTYDKRRRQADALDEMAGLEQNAYTLVMKLLSQCG